MILTPPRSTRTDTLFPYTTLFRSTAGLVEPIATASAIKTKLRILHIPRIGWLILKMDWPQDTFRADHRSFHRRVKIDLRLILQHPASEDYRPPSCCCVPAGAAGAGRALIAAPLMPT